MLAVYLKELRTYFTSAIGYIFISTFLLISGIFFALNNLLSGSSYYNGVLQNIVIIFLFIIPILTMRIMSEETKTRTDQLLLTSPLKIVDIVLGKYFAALTVFLIAVLITVIYPLILSGFGKVATAEIFTGYIGLILLGASCIAIGVFISSLTENQITSAIVTFGAILFIWLIDPIQQGLPNSRKACIIFAVIIVGMIVYAIYSSTRNIIITAVTATIGAITIGSIYIVKKELYDGLIQKVFGWFSLLKRYNMLTQGVLNVSSIVYYLSLCTIFIFFTIRVIDKRRWS